MKSSPRTTEWSQSRPGTNFVIVLIALNCLLLVVQLSSNLTTYDRSWWPDISNTRTKLLPTCSNSSLTNPVEENLHTSSIDLSRGEVQTFKPHGVASRLLVEVGAYRNGPRRFSFVAIGSKRLNNLHDHLYGCEWQNLEGKFVQAHKTRTIKPDWNMGRIYGTLVIVCDFDHDVGTKSEGGRLVITANYPDAYRTPEKFVALIEAPGEYNASRFQPPYPYEIAFCGSPLYGDISPQRIREWMAYHAWLFGENSIFIFQDAGGIHSDVYRVLQPWIELGRVRVLNLRKAEVYEGYYHHQFTMLNDCLLRTQTLANWTFFFDVDEFLYLPDGGAGLVELLKNSTRNNVTQIHFKNVKMSADLCRREPNVKVGTTLSPEFARWVWGSMNFTLLSFMEFLPCYSTTLLI